MRRAITTFACGAGTAWGHTGEAPEIHDLWLASLEPGTVIPIVLTAVLFALGVRQARGVTRIERACFWAGWTVLAISLVSPLHPLGEILFSAHMVQHELLMLVAAPLLVLAHPLVPMLRGLPMATRKRVGQWSKLRITQTVWHAITRPLAAASIHAAALWLWHAPFLFQATLRSEWVHAAQHLSFFGSALLFWWSLFYVQGRANYGAGVLYLFTTAAHTGILGALLTFSHTAWYPAYAQSTLAWGVSPLEDQQVGGLIMWVPASLVYIGAGLWMFALWLRESDVAAARRRYAAD